MALFGQKWPFFAKTTNFLSKISMTLATLFRAENGPKMIIVENLFEKISKISLKKYLKFLFIFYLLILFLDWGKSGLRLGFTVLFWGIKVNCLLRNQ